MSEPFPDLRIEHGLTIQLPSVTARAVSLKPGDRLAVEAVGETIVLRRIEPRFCLVTSEVKLASGVWGEVEDHLPGAKIHDELRCQIRIGQDIALWLSADEQRLVWSILVYLGRQDEWLKHQSGLD